MLKVDLREFFHSIDEIQVQRLLAGFGYPSLVAFEMGRLCTRVLDTAPTATTNNSYSIGAYQPQRLGVLPQGSPTSGALANRVAIGLDRRLDAIAARHQMVYTRYADDIALSTRDDLGHDAVRDLLMLVRRAVDAEGFELNDSKTRVFPPGAAKYLLGLLVLRDRVALARSFKRELERVLHGTTKYGIPSYAASVGFVSNIGFVNHVSGKLAFASSIEPEWAERSSQTWATILQGGGQKAI